MPSQTDYTRNYLGFSVPTIEAHIAQRTFTNSVAYLLPVLKSLPPDFTFLDVGCGPASITIDIARRYPLATILAIDGSPNVVSRAREAARKTNIHNIRFAVGDALNLASTASEPGFELIKGGCDVGESRNDAKLPRSFRIMEAKGGDPYVGRKLKAYAIAASFELADIRVGQTPWIISTREERKQWGGLVTRTSASPEARAQVEWETKEIGQDIDLQDLHKHWRAWIEDDRAFASISDFYVVCEKKTS
ncbi:putative methyltransferase domain-containing protein [Colletotrichum sublineola]|uniref:Putative methyltransferase domain-containing protein n=1 Tax=Colletotrichum sublineola TaxID=1173701 RepID=A0A066X2T6_COLSU|nr:putative methyltransferase domain-containing protein [Colletotrichum sublineola]